MSTGSPITGHYLDAHSVFAEVTPSQLPELSMPHIHMLQQMCQEILHNDRYVSTPVPLSIRQTISPLLSMFKIQLGLVLRRFVLRRFTFTTLVTSDRALPTFGATLSQLKRPFPT